MIVSFSFFAKYFDDGFIWVINQDVHEVIKLEAQMGTPRGQGGYIIHEYIPIFNLWDWNAFCPPSIWWPRPTLKEKGKECINVWNCCSKKKKCMKLAQNVLTGHVLSQVCGPWLRFTGPRSKSNTKENFMRRPQKGTLPMFTRNSKYSTWKSPGLHTITFGS